MARFTAFLVAILFTVPIAQSKTMTFCSKVKSKNSNKIDLNYPQFTPINEIIDAFAAMYQINLVYDRNVNGKIKLLTFSRKNDRQNCEILLAALNQLNLTLVETNEIYKIMPVRTALKNHLPYLPDNEKTPATHQRFRKIIKVRHSDVNWMRSSLAKIFGPNSLLVVEQSSSIIISQTGYRIQEFERLVRKLDKPCNKKCQKAMKSYLKRLERKKTKSKKSDKNKFKNGKKLGTIQVINTEIQDNKPDLSMAPNQSVTISKSEAKESLGDGYVKIMNAARLVPHVTNNEIDGFKIFAIKKDSIIKKLTLKNGDILKKINDETLTVDQGFLLYMSIEKAEDFSIDFLRKGKGIKLKVSFRD